MLLLFSCDDTLFNAGSTITKSIEIDDFDEIYVADIFEIFLIQDTICKIEVKAGTNLIPNLKFNVDEDKKLTINNENSGRWSRSYDKIELYISVDTLQLLWLDAPSKIVSQNLLITPELKIYSIDDFAEIDLNLSCNSCYVANSGTSGGIINLSGETNTFTFWARASVKINAENFIANYVSIKHESIADCSIHVNKTLSVEILREGNLYYKGDPESIEYMNEDAKDQLIKLD